jgi:hypothetical protein
MAKVKGIFFTFSAFFLVMLIVVLSLLVASALHQSNLRLMESGSIERVYDLDVSLERVIRGLDDGIDINLIWDDSTNTSILTISEFIDSDFSNYGSEFYSELVDLSNFVESDQPEISFDLDTIYNGSQKIPLRIEPIGFKYNHLESSGGTVLSIDPVIYVPSMSFEIYLPNTTMGSGITWTTQNAGGDFEFNISVSDRSGGSDSMSQMLNSTLENRFTIGSGITIIVGQACEQCVTLDGTTNNMNVNFSTRFFFSGETLTVNYPKGLYIMNFSGPGVYLNNSPRIL